MSDAAAALRRATPRTLLIMDELGRGTSTADGYAIAHAVLKSVAKVGARCLFATHYHQLSTDLRLDRPHVDQSADPVVARVHAAHMMAQAVPANPNGINGGGVSGADIRFCYRLGAGPAPLGSCAMNVARIAGFPPHLLARAAQVADTMRLMVWCALRIRRWLCVWLDVCV